MRIRRRPAIAVAAVVGILAVASAGAIHAFTDDPRLSACYAAPGGDNQVWATFELPAASRMWDVVPNLGISPELSSDSGPVFVVLFDGPARLLTAPMPESEPVASEFQNVMCVVSSSGTATFYTNVDFAGMRLP